MTGVPGAGKTLVGLNIATKHINKEDNLYSVFLSGNGPLVAILREALVRDKVSREKERGRSIKKGEAMSDVKMFIQNVHHFRDDCLRNLSPPIEHVALFDEAQRAWNLADFRYSQEGWEHWSFRGSRWQRINKPERQIYQKNAYRVLMTRARQGMAIVIPNGDSNDPTRNPAFYDATYNYLREIGFTVI